MGPTRKSDAGTVKIIDSRNFPASQKIAAAIVMVRPGCMREMHWHPNGSEWQYWINTNFTSEEIAKIPTGHSPLLR